MKFKLLILSLLLLSCKTNFNHYYKFKYRETSFWEYDGIGILAYNFTLGGIEDNFLFYEKNIADDGYTLISDETEQSAIKIYKNKDSEYVDLKVLIINDLLPYSCINDDENICNVNLLINDKKHEISTRKILNFHLNKDSLFKEKDSVILNLKINNRYRQKIVIDRSIAKITYLNVYNFFSYRKIDKINIINKHYIRDDGFKTRVKIIKIKDLNELMERERPSLR